MTLELLAVALGVGFLHAFYRTVESQWPTSYLSLTSGAGYAISASPFRYLAFRFGPVFVVGLFACVTLERANRASTMPVLGIAACHVGLTSARAAVAAFRRRSQRRWALFVMNLIVAIGIMLTAAATIGLKEQMAPVVPPIDEITSTMWTGLAAAVVAAYLIRISEGSHLDTYSQIEHSRRTVPDAIWAFAHHQSKLHGVDPLIVQSFLLVENIQRPRWFRRLENLWGRLGGSGTFGILQVRSSKRVSDEESILAALKGPLAGANVPLVTVSYGTSTYDRKDYKYLAGLALHYNPSSEYAELVTTAYRWAESDSEGPAC